MKPLSASWASRSMAGFLVFPLLPVQTPTENPSLAPAPPMGFNNWARFECDLNETFFTETAQAMLKRGLLDVGYDRLTLDDCWMLHDRVEDGSLEWDTDKFPHGIPWLANYMKRNGLHCGTYQEPGPRTRAWDSIMYNYDFHERLTTLASLRTRKKKSHFVLWASIGAPLILSAYTPSLSGEEIAFLSNKALIAVNQDLLGQQCALVSRDGIFDILPCFLENRDKLLTVLNRRADAVTTTVSLARLGLSSQSGCKYDARSLVTDEVLTIDSAIEIQLDSHVAKVYRIALPKSCTKTTPTGWLSILRLVFVWHVAATGDATKLTLSPLSDASVCLAAGDEDSLAKWQGGTGITWDH
ncbi:Glycoside hydrolase family 27 [Penicillium viridicatum]|nr:Glycoside hydrolase family 27 [Penicillium viridicatum]